MWLLSKKTLLAAISAALLAALAVVSWTPAADKDKSAAPTRKLPKPIVIQGKSKAADFADLKKRDPKNIPARKGRKLDPNKMQPAERLSHQEKIDVIKSAQPDLGKLIQKFDPSNIDFSLPFVSLTPRRPWVKDKAYLDIQGPISTSLKDSYLWLGWPEQVDINLNCPQIGVYLISCSLQTDPALAFSVAAPNGFIQGLGGPIKFDQGPQVLPIVFVTSDATYPWNQVLLYANPAQVLGPDDKNPGGWQLSWIEIQYLGSGRK